MSKCSKCGADTELCDGGVRICVKCSELDTDRQVILQILHQDLKVARKQRDRAYAHFDDTLRQVPSGIPYPDEEERIRWASRIFSDAQRGLSDALARLNDYLIDGKVPSGLEDHDARAKSA